MITNIKRIYDSNIMLGSSSNVILAQGSYHFTSAVAYTIFKFSNWSYIEYAEEIVW